TMRKKAILITGALGEIGQALIEHFVQADKTRLLTLDIRAADRDHPNVTHMQGDILDKALLSRIVSEYEIEAIYHLAALLSTRSEFKPDAAHHVNVEGTLKLLQLAADQSEWRGQPVKFIFPSSIAAYGLPDLDTKSRFPKVKEYEWNTPSTMYGCNKLYCEMLGTYYSRHYRQLSAEQPVMLDFRAVRFPGLISAFTVPSGGTSDYGPEMLHAAAKGEPYTCFVRPDTAIPFMAMPDAITALLKLAAAPRESLSRLVYNVTAFSLSAEQIRDLVHEAFPSAQITFEPHLKRQGIVDTWPIDADDNAARRDWGWRPEYDADRSFREYLIPNIARRYHG
ncbi:MAG TPA: NAD-dependent epimerase/dehydratase family protein, partial [Anaerolineales bacterium]|nr:NAD-dependent epimerase/dehydratase family protein [Anaerolineales bacterium]